MRALIIRNAYFHDFGGGERFPVHLAKELKKSDVDPIVVSRSPRLLEYAKNLNIRHMPGWWSSRQDWSGQNALLIPFYILWQMFLSVWYMQTILRTKANIVHPQSKDDFIAATLAGRLLGKKVVWTDHADLKYIYQNHSVWYKNPVGKLVYSMSKLAHHITLVSNSERKLIEAQLKHPVPKNYQVIHNGVIDEQITPIERNKNEVIFCATSRLVTAKGIGELIHAFRRLSEENPNTRLWLVGDGPESAKFKKQAANNPLISFVGHSDEPLSYVAACDIFVHPSYHEGFSLSLIEAAMLKKPIVACRVGGNPEIVKDRKTGILINERDEDSLYHAMKELSVNKDLRDKLAANARKLYVEDFQFNKLVKERYIPLYEK